LAGANHSYQIETAPTTKKVKNPNSLANLLQEHRFYNIIIDARTQAAINEMVSTEESNDSRPKTISETKRHILRTLETIQNFNNSPECLTPITIFDYRQTIKLLFKLKSYKNNKQLRKSYINRIIKCYRTFCNSNLIPMDRIKLTDDTPFQIIPTTNQVNAIINTCETDYTTIFTIMTQTAIEPEELHQIPIKQINQESGTLSVLGTKQHNNGIYTLKLNTANMLRSYLTRHTETKPFPRPKTMGEAWRRARNKAAKKLSQPELKTIPLKNLRNYAGAIFYLAPENKRDIIATQRFMRHKKLSTTERYLKNINLNIIEVQLETIAIKLGEPDTQKRIIELGNQGATKFTEADGYQYFTIPKTTK